MTDKNINFFFSIIICSYNSEKYISETLDSIIAQSFKKWEIIIVDDGSKDNSCIIIENYVKNNRNIKLIKQKNKGIAISRNIAVKNSLSEWVVIMDHDDLCDKNRLQNQYEEIINNQNCKLFFGDVILFDNKKYKEKRFSISRQKDNFDPLKLNLKKVEAYYNLIKYGCFIVSSSVVFNKKCGESIGFFDGKYKFITDYIFFLNFAYKFNLFCSDKIICHWRIHDQNLSKMLYQNSHPVLSLNRIYFYELNYFYFSCYFKRKLPIYLKIIVLKIQLRVLISLIRHKILNYISN